MGPTIVMDSLGIINLLHLPGYELPSLGCPDCRLASIKNLIPTTAPTWFKTLSYQLIGNYFGASFPLLSNYLYV